MINRIAANRQIGAARRAGDTADVARLTNLMNSNPHKFGPTVVGNGQPPARVGGGSPNLNAVPAVTGVSSPADRPPGNLLNGGKSSFQQPAPGLVPSDVGSGMNKAGGILAVTNVGLDLYDGKKSGTEIAGDALVGIGKGVATSIGAGAVGALIGSAFGPGGAAAGWEIGSTGATAILTTKAAVDTGERISQAAAERNVKQAMAGASGPTWEELPPLPGSPAERDQAKNSGWIHLPPVPGSAADPSGNSLLGPPPSPDPNAQWPVCPKCGKRHDPKE